MHRLAVPWAREGSGFTLLFEALLMTLVREIPARAAARRISAHDTRSRRMIDHTAMPRRAAKVSASLPGVAKSRRLAAKSTKRVM